MYCKIDFFNSNKNLCDLILAGATPLSADFWLLGGGGGGGGGGATVKGKHLLPGGSKFCPLSVPPISSDIVSMLK